MNAAPPTRLDQCDWVPATADRYPTLKSAIFVSGDDFLRLALQAYYAAMRDMVPPAGESWLQGGDGVAIELPYSCPEELQRSLLHHLGERLSGHAHKTGHFVALPARAGRSPADMGHGWPAFDPAVGPAPGPSPVADITRDGDQLFCAPTVQELPAGDNRADNRISASQRGK
jgi:hypothetical protein